MDIDFLTDGRRRLEEFKLLMRRLLDWLHMKKGRLLHQEMSDLHGRKAFDIVASSLGVPTLTPKGQATLASRAHYVAYLSQNHCLTRFMLVQSRSSSVPIRFLTSNAFEHLVGQEV